MSKKIIIANWKMNPQTLKEAENLFLNINKSIKNLKNTEIIICPPTIFLSSFKKIISQKRIKKIKLGAQNVFFEKEGAFTGEISSLMLKDSGAKFVIIGHSERREMGENDENISKKVLNTLKLDLTPILCIGENFRGSSTKYLSFVKDQIINSLNNIPKSLFPKIIFAYEPVWAIGKNAIREATPEESKEMSLYIRKIISDLADPRIAHDLKILYGGSVNLKNIEQFLINGGIQGVLVGSSSLSIKEFPEIIFKADKIK